MVTVGTDAHKSTHTLVAVDQNGRPLGQKTVEAVTVGHLAALRWARQWSERRWAIEDCRHVSRRLERDLLSAGEIVLRVPPRLMLESRQAARTRGKSDPIDALAVARASLREPRLPTARLDGRSRELRLLVDHREDLVAERTRVQNRLRWHLHELEPELFIAPSALDRYKVLDQLEDALQAHSGVVAEIAGKELRHIRELTIEIKLLERWIRKLVKPVAPSLLALVGCGCLTAAKLIGETAGPARFSSRAAFAMHNGSAPIPASSGERQRHRLNRGGNRQLNAALYRIAITQLQRPGRGRDYYQRRLAAGASRPEALRSLKRRISDQVYRCLRLDAHLFDPVGDAEPTAA
jgi:transposase